MATVSQIKLRRLAQRVQLVLGRHIAGSPELRVLEQPVSAAVTRFMTLFDQGKRDQQASSRMLRDAKEKVAVLRTRMSAWRGALQRDEIAGSEDLDLSPNVPDQLFAEGKRFVALVEGAQQDGALAYGAEVLASVTPAFESASSAWIAAQNALGARQEQMVEVQKAADELNQQLIVLRRTLRDIIGSKHRDYRKLKAELGTTESDEDETGSDNDTEVIVAPTMPGEPAPSNDTTVTNGTSKPIAA